MIERLSFLLSILGSKLLVKFFIIIIKQQFFVNVKYILLFGSERVSGSIDATLISFVAQCLSKYNLVVSQIAVLDVRSKHKADALLGRSDMHQCRALHQPLVLLPHLIDFERIVHMVNVEHHQTIQMAIS